MTGMDLLIPLFFVGGVIVVVALVVLVVLVAINNLGQRPAPPTAEELDPEAFAQQD